MLSVFLASILTILKVLLFGWVAVKQAHAEQVVGREAETATLLSSGLLTFGGLGGGFRPPHLKRYTP